MELKLFLKSGRRNLSYSPESSWSVYTGRILRKGKSFIVFFVEGVCHTRVPFLSTSSTSGSPFLRLALRKNRLPKRLVCLCTFVVVAVLCISSNESSEVFWTLPFPFQFIPWLVTWLTSSRPHELRKWPVKTKGRVLPTSPTGLEGEVSEESRSSQRTYLPDQTRDVLEITSGENKDEKRKGESNIRKYFTRIHYKTLLGL